jgi:hypothetical protein
MTFPESWTPWPAGGDCPIDPETVINAWFRSDGSEAEALDAVPVAAGKLRWDHHHDPRASRSGSGDIIAYREFQ